MSYNTATRTFVIFTIDFELIGVHEFSISAEFNDYPSTRTSDEVAKITIIDPCLDPDLVQASEQEITELTYNYSGSSPKLEFTMTPFIIEPPICEVKYSCELISGPIPDLDLCSVSDGLTEAILDSGSGNFEL